MTRWQHFRHAFGLHVWKKVREYDMRVTRDRCGSYDPGPSTREIRMVDVVCCYCNRKRMISWRQWVGI